MAVTKIKLHTSPCVCVRHFNIARIAWRNLKPAADNNGGGIALISNVAFDYTSVGGHVDVAVVMLPFAAARLSARCASSAPPQQNIARTIRGAHHHVS